MLLKRDFLAGAIFILIGAVGLTLSSAYEQGALLNMGPGYFPRLLSWGLMGMGVIVALPGMLKGAERIALPNLRPAVLVLGALVLFAGLLNVLGLLLAGILMVVVGSLASEKAKRTEVILLALGLSVGASALFVFALGLPIRMLPY